MSRLYLTTLIYLQGVRRKNQLILRLMEALVYPNPAFYREHLIRFAALNHINHCEVCVCESSCNACILVEDAPWLWSLWHQQVPL
jgi:hypothetical protein